MKFLILFKTQPFINLLVHIDVHPNLVINDAMEFVSSKGRRGGAFYRINEAVE